MTPTTKSGPDTSTPTSDGGRIALSGFLYQILGVLGLRAATGCAEPDGGDGIWALFSLVLDETVVAHEPYDSDVGLLHDNAASSTKGVTLVQFKYSSAGASSEIHPSEFEKILTRYNVACEAAVRDGRIVAGRFLVTNRGFGQRTQQIMTDVGTSGVSDKLNAVQNRMANGLHMIPGIQPETWINRLYEFAYTYGLSDSEIRDGVERLVTRVFARTVDNPLYGLTAEEFTSTLAGARGPRCLRHSVVAPLMTMELNRIETEPKHQIIDRRSADARFAEYTNRALVICTGSGGTGKTASLRKWAASTYKTHFIGSCRPSNVKHDWICRLVERWRHVPAPQDTELTALMRLSCANPTLSAPLLHLNIDGADEFAAAGDNTYALSCIFDWFWKEDQEVVHGWKAAPDAKLIVTCRRVEDLDRFWCLPRNSSASSGLPGPALIDFTNFSADDFSTVLQAERGNLDNATFVRLAQTVSNPLAIPFASIDTPMANDREAGRSQPVNEYEAMLRHPAMWGAYLMLTRDHQASFLDGNQIACFALASHFVDRFVSKTCARKQGMDRSILRYTLRILATFSAAADPPPYPQSLWSQTIRAEIGLADEIALSLFTEALSGAMIDEDDGAWRWRYPLVQTYLTSERRAI